jgi:ribA/ribD-fused uncharacterized protein
MPQIGGKPKVSKATKAPKKKSSSTSKRHFTVVIGSKEHGIYVSSSPSSAARKAVSKLCATDKKRKVQFHIREITQKSDKKTYGPYLGYIEKLAKPIELKGRVIRYKPVAKLSGKSSKKRVVKKGGMRGGDGETDKSIFFISSSKDYDFLSNFYPCEFIDDDEFNNTKQQIVFKNMEQYFMYRKAKMFDKTMIKEILTETNPRIIQGYGKKVKNYNDEEWNKHKIDIMYRGLELKFGQNPEILDKLLKTENKRLYEANKFDRYWGIGCDVETGMNVESNSNSVLDENGTPVVFGANMLGKLLMKLRDSFLTRAGNNNN